MSTYAIRPARPGDGAGAAKTWLDFADYYRAIAPDAFQAPRGDGLPAWMETKLLGGGEDSFVRVCDHDGEAVGFVHATFMPPHEEADRQVTLDACLPRVYVNALALQRRHWRGGAGTALMKAVEQWGLDRGAELLTLETFAASPVSVPFYEERMGYERHAIVFSKTLTP
ncbi:GNAT family N-acetyltransferase [Actinomadura darangshiensis]|uniref:GNAT family N-acetyltransferase n=1 Tax=Actinomadura darangshiensis TaxID=705336 RepID=A0A4R5BX44_9ACTN|nr:GNAT family N-acetyltransferase [Actinomadura darangshiensis]TDD88904.1 GNAT family N-acetyltransferase [Actinomadura darangshiensis]